MATSKAKKADSKPANFNFRSIVRNDLVPMANDTDKNESHIPWSLLISLVVLCLVLVIALPVMGIMYLDMNNATVIAIDEIRKMRELRSKIILEMEQR